MKFLAVLKSPDAQTILQIGVLVADLFGRGDRARHLATVIGSVPGRLEALESAKAKIDAAADTTEQDDGAKPSGLILTVDELQALDDYLDVQSYTSRKLRKLAKRVA